MLLCNLPQTIMLAQLKLLLIDNGVSGKGAAFILSAMPAGMLAGRFATGLALDRYPPQFVSFFAMAAPSLGLLVLASSWDAPAVLFASVFCVGLAFGAEGDILGYLVSRCFSITIYSSVMGLLTCAVAVSASAGAAILSFTLERTGGYNFYLVTSACAVLVGAGLILLIGTPRAEPHSSGTSPDPAGPLGEPSSA